MRVISGVLMFLLLYQVIGSAQEKTAAPETVAVLKEGAFLPAPFYAFVLNGPRKDRLRCLINEKADKTFILMFFQNTVVPDYLPKALEELNGKLKANKDKNAPSFAMVILVHPEIKSIVRDDEKRNEFAKAIRTVISEESTSFIDIGLDDLQDLQQYNIQPTDSVLILRVENLKVTKILKLNATSASEEGFTKELAGVMGNGVGK